MNRIMNRTPAEMIDELMYSPMNPHFPYHSTFPQNSQNNYPNFVEPQYDSMYTNGPVYPLPTQTLPGLEGTDGDNKKYLTQEDQSVLMAEFMQESKPSTDAKRTMAQKLGVDPSKVSVSISSLHVDLELNDRIHRTGFRIVVPGRNFRSSLVIEKATRRRTWIFQHVQLSLFRPRHLECTMHAAIFRMIVPSHLPETYILSMLRANSKTSSSTTTSPQLQNPWAYTSVMTASNP